jgi:hypothetical protein
MTVIKETHPLTLPIFRIRVLPAALPATGHTQAERQYAPGFEFCQMKSEGSENRKNLAIANERQYADPAAFQIPTS